MKRPVYIVRDWNAAKVKGKFCVWTTLTLTDRFGDTVGLSS